MEVFQPIEQESPETTPIVSSWRDNKEREMGWEQPGNGNVGAYHVPGTSFRFAEREHGGTPSRQRRNATRRRWFVLPSAAGRRARDAAASSSAAPLGEEALQRRSFLRSAAWLPGRRSFLRSAVGLLPAVPPRRRKRPWPAAVRHCRCGHALVWCVCGARVLRVRRGCAWRSCAACAPWLCVAAASCWQLPRMGSILHGATTTFPTRSLETWYTFH
jgi:hypothetical protein